MPRTIVRLAALLLFAGIRFQVFSDDLADARKAEQSGNMSRAIELYSTWLVANRSDPDWDATLIHAADITTLAPNEISFLTSLLPSITQRPTRHEVLVRLAQVYELLGDAEKAQSYFADASLVQGQHDYASLLSSSRLLFEMGDTDRASSQARAVLDLCKDEATVTGARVLLARIAGVQGDADAAHGMLESLLSGKEAGGPAALTPELLLQIYGIAKSAALADIAERSIGLLKQKFPASPEAALAQSKIGAYPTASLLLAAPQSAEQLATSAPALQTAPPQSPSTAPPASGTPSANQATANLSVAAPAASKAGSTQAAQTVQTQEDAGSGDSRTASIQVGSYVDQQNAAYRLKDLETAGFQGQVISVSVGGKQYYRVVVAPVPLAGEQEWLTRLKEKGFEGVLINP